MAATPDRRRRTHGRKDRHDLAAAHLKAQEAEDLVWALEKERTELEERMEEIMELNEELESEAQIADQKLPKVFYKLTYELCG